MTRVTVSIWHNVAQPGIKLLAATGDDRLDPSLANLLAVFVMVVAAIA
jgi:hypothetical protein